MQEYTRCEVGWWHEALSSATVFICRVQRRDSGEKKQQNAAQTAPEKQAAGGCSTSKQQEAAATCGKQEARNIQIPSVRVHLLTKYTETKLGAASETPAVTPQQRKAHPRPGSSCCFVGLSRAAVSKVMVFRCSDGCSGNLPGKMPIVPSSSPGAIWRLNSRQYLNDAEIWLDEALGTNGDVTYAWLCARPVSEGITNSQGFPLHGFDISSSGSFFLCLCLAFNDQILTESFTCCGGARVVVHTVKGPPHTLTAARQWPCASSLRRSTA